MNKYYSSDTRYRASPDYEEKVKVLEGLKDGELVLIEWGRNHTRGMGLNWREKIDLIIFKKVSKNRFLLFWNSREGASSGNNPIDLRDYFSSIESLKKISRDEAAVIML